MTTINTPKAALDKLGARATKDLIRDVITTSWMIDTLKKAVDPNIFTVRGWLLDEIERRDPEGYDAWIDSDADDDGLYQYIHC